MVVDNIHDNSNTMLMGRLHEPLECVRPTVNTRNGKGMRWIVAPRKVARKLRDRHHFHGIDTQVVKVGQFFNGTIQGARLPLFFHVKGADMHLVNDELIPRCHVKGSITPVKGFRIIDNPVAD